MIIFVMRARLWLKKFLIVAVLINSKATLSEFLSPTTPTKIFHQINSIKNSKSCGHDEVSSYFLKVAANILAAPLSYFFNTCFTSDIFPDCLKIAKVIPVFKWGSKTDTTNYRPISILSPFSKTTAYLEKHWLLLPTQFGSTTHALLDVGTSCYDNINDTNYTALLFLDPKKAFDSVKHEIFIHKLEHYGIRGVALDLFSSFLTGFNTCRYTIPNPIRN